ncbi:hypothetical protein AQUCO_00400486v1 [Aquilegia coerulea]|uniref:Non-structural maintenance of chromosomes element 4 n=1 Tax=Aquilegia coerulea TaxID=218851 RepID=A0A2G5EV34_AQUCA|nr:hypothetical protein AQUCO_00400486v1 [Aquilegia coerulea]
MGEAVNGDSVKQTQTVYDRRVIRSDYFAVKTLINDGRDEIGKPDSEKFNRIISEVERIHQQVQKPREQVADAEALNDLSNILKVSVKAELNDGINPSDFVTALLGEYCNGNEDDARTLFTWGDLGFFSSHIFKKAYGCNTMVGPMNTQLKQRKAMAPRKRARLSASVCPEELNDADAKETETDKNISAMFDILKKNRTVKLEHLVLNRTSFAQTVENIFALSFLSKDGRVQINVDENNCHLVSPRNGPTANEVASKEASYFHFVFRFDFQDWKLMKGSVGVGEELMPQRSHKNESADSLIDKRFGDSPSTTPALVKKYSRNHGHVVQNHLVEGNLYEMDAEKS